MTIKRLHIEFNTEFKHCLYELLCAVYVNFKSLTRHAYAKILFLNGTQQQYIRCYVVQRNNKRIYSVMRI